MKVPTGTRLMSTGVRMTSDDLSLVIQNMSEEDVSGFLRWQWASDRSGYVFFAQGDMLAAMELAGGVARVCKPGWLLDKAGSTPVAAESWLMSPRWARILACSFGLRCLEERTLAAREVRALVERMEREKLTGFAHFQWDDKESVVGWEQGELLHESHISAYGSLLCGKDEIAACLDAVHTAGARVSLFAEDLTVVEKEGRRIQENLERLTYLGPKPVSGFFASKDTLKLDSEHFKRWGVSGTVQLGVEDIDGRALGVFKAQAANGKGQTLEVPLKILESWGLPEGARVGVYPPA